ncbi:MAG: cytidine deaminase [Bifidobacteriaceae bacterium]|jgi:cytidine deaminase|nr:cytidine deaminase [Bifidobacteriaceae bacterium]
MTDASAGAVRPVPWPQLVRHAIAATAHAYAPYSNYRVGAAALADAVRSPAVRPDACGVVAAPSVVLADAVRSPAVPPDAPGAVAAPTESALPVAGGDRPATGDRTTGGTVGEAAAMPGERAPGAGPRLVTGANVENASYGLTLCAECSLVSALHTTGGGKLIQFVCVDGSGTVVMPCGRCRQLLWEHGGPDLRILTPQGEQRLSQVLPQAWGPANLAASQPERAGPAGAATPAELM